MPLRVASGGRVSGATTQRCLRVTVRVAFFAALGFLRGVGGWRSASEEWFVVTGGTGGVISSLAEAPFRRASSSRCCWISMRWAAFSATSVSMRFSNCPTS